MAVPQSQTETSPGADGRTGAAHETAGVPARDVIPSLPDPPAHEAPLDLTEQIETLLSEIEQAAREVDPWGDAAQRGADRDVEQAEHTVEPSQKLLAKIRAEEPTVESRQTSDEALGGTAALPEQSEPVAPAALDEELNKLIAENEPTRPARTSTPSETDPGAHGGATRSALAQELDAALQEATSALEEISPPADPAHAEVAAIPAHADEAAASPGTATRAAHAESGPNASAGAGEVPAGTADAEGVSDAESLDVALAEQAEALAAAPVQEPTAACAESTPAPGAPPAGGESPGAPEPPADTTDHAGASAGAPPGAHVTRASHTTRAAETRVNRPDAAPAAPPRVSPHAGTQGAPAAPHGGGRGSPVAWVGAVVEKLGEILASPLALLPVAARDAVGYLAAVTLFNALAVWAYMLIVHKPAEAPRGHEGPALHSAEPGDAPQGVEARTNPAEHAKATPEGAGSRAQQPDHAAPPHARTSEPRHH